MTIRHSPTGQIPTAAGAAASEADTYAVPPPGAAAAFGSALGRAEAFARILATRGVEQGLIGPHQVPRLWDRHLLNCAVVAELSTSGADAGAHWVRRGTPRHRAGHGAAGAHVTLLEPMERRCRFLSECVAELGLTNADMLRGRAEDVVLRADVATARAVAPLDRLAELAIGVVRPGGMVLAIKGRTAADELKKARPVLWRIGARSAEVVHAGQGKVVPATTVVRFFAR